MKQLQFKLLHRPLTAALGRSSTPWTMPAHNMLSEDTLRNIIKGTIDKSIEEKIKSDLGKLIYDLKENYDKKIDTLQTDNNKKTILEQQKFLEGMRREKVKNNVFVTGIPTTYNLHEGDENVCADTKLIVQRAFQILYPAISTDNYTVEHRRRQERSRFLQLLYLTPHRRKQMLIISSICI